MRIGIRQLRNDVSRVIRRAQGGERIVVTVDGVSAAQVGPLNDGVHGVGVEDLIAAGLLPRPLTFVTFDHRQAGAGRRLGLEVVGPA